MSDADADEAPEPTPVLRWWCCNGTVTHCWCPHRPVLPEGE